jgi:FMN phosphatase YigB (HAD superfamily)
MTNGIEAVVFDIGNVLIEWQPERYYDATIGEDRRRAMFAEVDLHGMNDRVDMGEGFRDVIYETAEAYPHGAPRSATGTTTGSSWRRRRSRIR